MHCKRARNYIITMMAKELGQCFMKFIKSVQDTTENSLNKNENLFLLVRVLKYIIFKLVYEKMHLFKK